MILVLSILVMALNPACTEDDCCVMPEPVCYDFDVRACRTDVFADDVSETASLSKRKEQMLQWLSDQGLAVVDVDLTIGFHEVVCKACDLCPQGDRYHVRLNETLSDQQIESFRLLNLTEATCEN